MLVQLMSNPRYDLLGVNGLANFGRYKLIWEELMHAHLLPAVVKKIESICPVVAYTWFRKH
jgi:hypothetical protein